MTLEEALERIKELEKENAELKGQPKNRRVSHPEFETILPRQKYGIDTNDLSRFVSSIRGAIFGKTIAIRRPKEATEVRVNRASKTVYELGEDEYIYYTEFYHKLLTLIKETVDGWKEREQ